MIAWIAIGLILAAAHRYADWRRREHRPRAVALLGLPCNRAKTFGACAQCSPPTPPKQLMSARPKTATHQANPWITSDGTIHKQWPPNSTLLPRDPQHVIYDVQPDEQTWTDIDGTIHERIRESWVRAEASWAGPLVTQETVRRIS